MDDKEKAVPPAPTHMGWKELYLKEDWWAIWLGLGIVIVAFLFFASGSSIKWIAVTPAGPTSASWGTISPLISASISPSLSCGW